MSDLEQTPSLCEQVRDAMSEVLDGSAAEALHEHVSGCDTCRDARHDAEQALTLVKRVVDEAAADYVHSDDFEARLEAQLTPAEPGVHGSESEAAANGEAEADPESDATSEPELSEPELSEPELAEPELSEPELSEPELSDSGSQQQPAGATEPGLPPVGAAVTAPHDRDSERELTVSAGGPRGSLRWLRRPRNTVITGVVAAALAAAAVALLFQPEALKQHDAVAEAWHGKVLKVVRAAGGEGGLEVCEVTDDEPRCALAQDGQSVPAGATLKTDGRTRAYLELNDGSRVVLDRATELRLDGERGRRARLGQGALVVEVKRGESKSGTVLASGEASKPAAPAKIDLPQGRVEILGTKLALRSDSRSSAVDVARGTVKLFDDQDRAVTVRSGEEGRLFAGVPPYATAAPRLAEALAWSEQDDGGEEIVVRGLGELRAQKPGEREERKGAVTLTSHQVKVRIVDGFARTEIDEVFSNNTDEVLEGIYRFPLPPDAQIERLAMEVDGKMEEGAFVGRERAAKIWRGAIINANRQARRPREEIIWVPGPWKDPALLEWQRGGRFELRIFPIPKKGSRRVVLSYTQAVAPTGATRRYVYPLPHDPSGSLRVGEFGLDVEVRGHDVASGVSSHGYALETRQTGGNLHKLTMTARDFVPSGDLVVEYALANADKEMSAWAYQPVSADGGDSNGNQEAKPAPKSAAKSANEDAKADAARFDDRDPYLALALRPKLPRWSEERQRAYVLVLDASRSMFGERFRRASALAGRVVQELDRLDRFTVLACDTTCRPMPGGLQIPSDSAATQVNSFLAGIAPEGGSDITAAIRDAGAVASSAPDRDLRVVYIGDGTPTVGPIRPRYIADAVGSAVSRGRGTVTAVAIGADSDLDALGALARGGGGVMIPYVPGRRTGEAAFAILGASYGMGLSDVSVELPAGVERLTPAAPDTMAAGSETLMFARMTQPEVSGDVVLRGTVGDRPFEQRYPLNVRATSDDGNAFVPRLFAASRIAELERESTAEARGQAVTLSGAFNVASRHTSLLVLESPAMFRAFGLDNKRSVPVWTGERDTDKSEADAQGLDDEPGYGSSSFGGEKSKKGERRFGRTGVGFGGGGLAPRPAPTSLPRKDAAPAPAPGAPMAVDENFSAPPPPPPPSSSKLPSSRCSPGDPLCSMEKHNWDPPPPRRRPPPRQRMIPMRRVFERHGTVDTNTTVPRKASSELVRKAELAVRENDNRRALVKDLYVLYALAGEIDRAAELAERWSSKEALDPQALTARADTAARQGKRAEAIRVLGSVVDVRPGDVASQKRLARLHRWAGAPALGCRHAIAIAQLQPDDAELLAESVHCGRQTGESLMVDAMLAAASDKTRDAAKARLKGIDDDERLRGELRLNAEWSGDADVDLGIVHPDGHRVSWLGAPTRELISATNVTSRSQEGLALMGSGAGEYALEVVRGEGEGRVSGDVTVRAAGGFRKIPFTLEAGQQRVSLGIARIQFRSRLVRAW